MIYTITLNPPSENNMDISLILNSLNLKNISKDDIVVISGEVSEDKMFSATISAVIKKIREKGANIIFNISGMSFYNFVEEKLFFVVAVENELEEIFKEPISTIQSCVYYGKKIHEFGVKNVMIFHKEKGIIFISEDDSVYVTDEFKEIKEYDGETKNLLISGFISEYEKSKELKKSFLTSVCAFQMNLKNENAKYFQLINENIKNVSYIKYNYNDYEKKGIFNEISKEKGNENIICRVIVSEPIGEINLEKFTVNQLNYGYIDNMIFDETNCKEKHFAYILGVDVPIDEFTGRLVAIVRRNDESGDIGVVVPENLTYTRQQIMEMIYFEEQYHDSFIEMINEEMWDAYDTAGNKLDFQIPRSMAKVLPKGIYHVVVMVYTITKNGKILVTQRSLNKTNPLKWEVTGGSILSGETPQYGAVRELLEETGIRKNVSEIREVYQHRDDKRHGLYYGYFNIIEEETDIKLQEGETMNYEWLGFDEFVELVLSDRFLNSEKSRLLNNKRKIINMIKNSINNVKIPNVLKNDMLLYAITDRQWLEGKDFYEVVEDVCRNGITFLQLREKNASTEEIAESAAKIKEITDKYNIPFVIDDDIYAALESGADGVHIGQSDMDYVEARKILGSDKIIGMTVKNAKQAIEAEKLGADYLGVGAVFHTSTKKDAVDMSRETLLEITQSVSIPVVAIGGITYDNMDYLKDTGVSGISVISAIFAKKNEGQAALQLREKAQSIFE